MATRTNITYLCIQVIVLYLYNAVLDPRIESYPKKLRSETVEVNRNEISLTTARLFTIGGFGLVYNYGSVDFYVNSVGDRTTCPNPLYSQTLRDYVNPDETISSFASPYNQGYEIFTASLSDQCLLSECSKAVSIANCSGQTCDPLGSDDVYYTARDMFQSAAAGMVPYYDLKIPKIDLPNLIPVDPCYPKVGCFSMTSPWLSLLRPIPPPQSPADNDVQFYLYTNGQPNRFTVRSDGDMSVDGSDFDGKRTTYFITHGFSNTGNMSWQSDLKDAILSRYNGNVFLVDWGSSANNTNYLQAAANTRVVAAVFARFGKHLIANAGAHPSRFHLIGHSLGAQISSYVAKRIPSIAHLTALDPAQPGFEGYDKEVRLDRTDAEFVQVVHTTARPFVPLVGLGMIQECGHVDFYMNGGADQPGCNLQPSLNVTSIVELATMSYEVIYNMVACPHSRAYEYLTASLTHNCTFWGRTQGTTNCSRSTCSPLGLESSQYPARGSFHVITTGDAPFCVHEPRANSAMRRFRTPSFDSWKRRSHFRKLRKVQQSLYSAAVQVQRILTP